MDLDPTFEQDREILKLQHARLLAEALLLGSRAGRLDQDAPTTAANLTDDAYSCLLAAEEIEGKLRTREDAATIIAVRRGRIIGKGHPVTVHDGGEPRLGILVDVALHEGQIVPMVDCGDGPEAMSADVLEAGV